MKIKKRLTNLEKDTYITLSNGIVAIDGEYDPIRDRYPVRYCEIDEEGTVSENGETGYLTPVDLIDGEMQNN